MGWKPGKLLKKAFKGVKKVAKKIGKGIKKLAFKVLGAFNKLGPIGQLALMFIGIPPVIGNFFAAIPGAVGSALGGFAQSVLPKAFTTAVQGAWGAIKTAGQGVYNTITEAIGNGLDRVTNFAKGKGFTLSGDRTSIFGGVSAKDIQVPTIDPETVSRFGPQVPDTTGITEETFFEKMTAPIDTGTVELVPKGGTSTLADVATQSATTTATAAGPYDPASLLIKDPVKFGPQVPDTSDIFTKGMEMDFGDVGKVVTDEATMMERTKEYLSNAVEGVKESLSDPKELAKETVKGGVISGGASRIASKIAGPPPTQRVIHANIGDFFTPTNQQRLLDSTTWTGMVGDYQKAGAYGGAMHGDAASPYFAAASGMSLDVYGQLAPRTAPSNATSSTYGTAYYPTISL